MSELKALYEELGYNAVQTYLQSGNVVFSSADKVAAHGRRIQEAIAGRLGLMVPVLVLSKERFAKLATLKPVFHGTDIDEAFLHVTFLFEAPKLDFPSDALPKSEGEAAVFREGHVYVYCPHGYGRTKLNNSYFERKLKTLATTRNWRTVQALYLLSMAER